MDNAQASPMDATLDAPMHFASSAPMNIGATIREIRLERNMSQGDIEKRTGLLRCYLSRVENGHTIPSLDTLQKIANALEIPLGQFFCEEAVKDAYGFSLSPEEIKFLTQVQRYSAHLGDNDRKILLAMVRKFAATSSTSIS